MSVVLRSKIIENYEKFKTNNDISSVSELVCSTVIPNFDLVACDIDEIIVEIENKYNDNQILDYIELVFSSSLYDSIITQLRDLNIEPEYNYFHYLMILVEVTKIDKYNEIKDRLNQINKSVNIEVTSRDIPFGLSMLVEATEDKIKNCKDRINNIYSNLLNNFPELTNSRGACEELLKANQFI